LRWVKVIVHVFKIGVKSSLKWLILDIGGKPYKIRLSRRYLPTGFTHFPHLYNISLDKC